MNFGQTMIFGHFTQGWLAKAQLHIYAISTTFTGHKGVKIHAQIKQVSIVFCL